MAEFTNQASLRYNDTVTNSNIVVGNIVQSLEITKTAVRPEYYTDEDTTYVISITNSSAEALVGLTVTDNLGAYQWNEATLVPLSYIEGSLRYYVNGVLQPELDPDAGETLVIPGVSVPANGNAMLIYEVRPNIYAPSEAGSTITNTATAEGRGVAEIIAADEVVTVSDRVLLSISKSVEPTTVTANGQITYTFVIQNTGNAPADAAVAAIVEDTFDPALQGLTATYNGTALVAGKDYTYDQTTGAFETAAGTIQIDAAAFARNETTGAFAVTPSVGVLVVSGTI